MEFKFKLIIDIHCFISLVNFRFQNDYLKLNRPCPIMRPYPKSALSSLHHLFKLYNFVNIFISKLPMFLIFSYFLFLELIF